MEGMPGSQYALSWRIAKWQVHPSQCSGLLQCSTLMESWWIHILQPKAGTVFCAGSLNEAAVITRLTIASMRSPMVADIFGACKAPIRLPAPLRFCKITFGPRPTYILRTLLAIIEIPL